VFIESRLLCNSHSVIFIVYFYLKLKERHSGHHKYYEDVARERITSPMHCKLACGPVKSAPVKAALLGSGGITGSSLLLLLIPKCPMCLATLLMLFTSAGTALAIAAHLREILMIVLLLFISCLGFFAVLSYKRWSPHPGRAKEK
jgi:hypothetical protein